MKFSVMFLVTLRQMFLVQFLKNIKKSIVRVHIEISDF